MSNSVQASYLLSAQTQIEGQIPKNGWISEVEGKLGYHFKDHTLLVTAFIHRSYKNECSVTLREDNERLEFLGDSVLDLIVGEHLYFKYSDKSEGFLTKMRQQLVEASACAKYVEQLGLGSYLFLGSGEQQNIGKARNTLHANLFESLLGAIYLDGGYSEAKNIFIRNFAQEFEKISESPHHNWKGELQEYFQEICDEHPVYKIIAQKGPAHRPCFMVAVYVGEHKFGEGEGCSKKEAETKAAANIMQKINDLGPDLQTQEASPSCEKTPEIVENNLKRSGFTLDSPREEKVAKVDLVGV